jgi:hypothetical protein
MRSISAAEFAQVTADIAAGTARLRAALTDLCWYEPAAIIPTGDIFEFIYSNTPETPEQRAHRRKSQPFTSQADEAKQLAEREKESWHKAMGPQIARTKGVYFGR